jgi:hypothetical protein
MLLIMYLNLDWKILQPLIFIGLNQLDYNYLFPLNYFTRCNISDIIALLIKLVC